MHGENVFFNLPKTMPMGSSSKKKVKNIEIDHTPFFRGEENRKSIQPMFKAPLMSDNEDDDPNKSLGIIGQFLIKKNNLRRDRSDLNQTIVERNKLKDGSVISMSRKSSANIASMKRNSIQVLKSLKQYDSKKSEVSPEF
jgi:hypothetical protein